jgi:integrase
MPTTLTNSNVKALRPRACAYFTWDSQAVGLALRVTPPGRKIWVVQLTFPGQAVQSRRTLGHWPTMLVEEARAQARQWRDLTRQGQDPKEVEAERRKTAERARLEAGRAAENTFEKVAESYIATKHGRTADKDAGMIRLHLVKPWEGKAVASIMPRDVRDVIGALAKRAPYAANQVWSHASQLFAYAVHEELIEQSPMASLKKKLTLNGAKLEARKRTLTDAELRKLWAVAGDLGYPDGDFYRLLMLTGCRLREAAQAQWPEFDLAGALWTIPSDREGNKSDQVRLVPLSKRAVRLLKGIADEDERSGFVFSNDGGDTAINGFGKMKDIVDAGMGADVPAFVNHDIRRTLRTNLAALGVDDHVAELVIGHGRRGLQRVYDQHKYVAEMRAALVAWSNRLATIIR